METRSGAANGEGIASTGEAKAMNCLSSQCESAAGSSTARRGAAMRWHRQALMRCAKALSGGDRQCKSKAMRRLDKRRNRNELLSNGKKPDERGGQLEDRTDRRRCVWEKSEVSQHGKTEDEQMGAFQDLTGQRYGNLTVVILAWKDHKGSHWLCRCDCGNEKVIRPDALKSGRTKSCGCLIKKVQRERNTTHGLHKSRIYQCYYAMRERCLNPNEHRYSDYGGRGITICDEWLGENGFQNFHAWAMGNGYTDELTLDRIDVNGNYCPENCRWATRAQQSDNTRRTKRHTYNGETHTLREWSEITGLPLSTLRSRDAVGWDSARLLSTPVQKQCRNNRYTKDVL